MRRFLRLGLGFVVSTAALLLIDWHGVLPILGSALSKAFSREALAVSVIGRVASLAACAAGLRVLAARLTSTSALLSRWVRDGVGSLPAGLPGLGEAAGIRILSLFGVPAADAVALTAADLLAETLAQAVYTISAALLAPSSLRLTLPQIDFPVGPILAGVFLVGLATFLVIRFSPMAWRHGLRTVLTQTKKRLRSGRFAASFGLHFAAWAMGGVQIFLLAQSLGAPLTLLQALSLEGLVFALRAAFFFVPAGAGVQEIGVAAVGAAYGLAPIDAAAIAVLLRLRDIVVLVPALLVWVALEARRALRRPHTPVSG